jgi:hypothetical protein
MPDGFPEHLLSEVEEVSSDIHPCGAGSLAGWNFLLEGIEPERVQRANPHADAAPGALLRIDFLNHRLTPLDLDLSLHRSKR